MTRFLAEVHVVVEVPVVDLDSQDAAALVAETYVVTRLRKAGLEVEVVRSDAVEDSDAELFEVPC